MAKIFFSYRRQDSAAAAGRIYDRLRQHFGADAVIIDIDSIPFGVDLFASGPRRVAGGSAKLSEWVAEAKPHA
jgi:hypothetical protein